MLSVNEILMANEGCTAFEGVVRVVAVAADTRTVALMRLGHGNLRAPFCVAMEDIRNSLRANGAVRVQEFANDVAISDEDLTWKQREELARVENQMRPLLDDLETLIFDPIERGRAFESRALKCGISERTLRRHFYEYLAGGMTKYALIGPVIKRSKKQCLGHKRRGRAGVGPTLPEVRDQLVDGAKRFYLNGKYTLQEAFNLLLEKHFRNNQKRLILDGSTVSFSESLKPEDQLPSKRQFRYVCECLEAEMGKRKQKPGQARVPKEGKTLMGKARDGVRGPGYRFEIDATRYQVQLVSRFGRRWLIGEVTVYIIIDIWSTAIVGYSVSINPPSWDVARAALLNCFTDKTDVFKRLDLPYTSEDWPACQLPARIAADRGEFISTKASVVPDIGIKLEIMPSMCPEAKGSVEHKFKRLKHGNNFYLLPGKHAKNPGRREDDGKWSAALTPDELERIIVEIIVDINNEPVPLSHIPSAAIDAGYKAITRIGLYVWGLEHKPGHTRTLPPKDVFAHLLSRDQASATSSGIKFRKQNYRSPRLAELGYRRVAQPISIGYVDSCADRIWFYDSERNEVITAENDNVEIRRSRATFREVELFLVEAEKLRQEATNENIHQKSEKAKRINKPTVAAVLEAKEQRRNLTKTEAKADLRLNVAVEREAERHRRVAEMSERYASSDADTEDVPTVSPVEPSKPMTVSAVVPKSIGNISRELW